jgi:hypothetical protein
MDADDVCTVRACGALLKHVVDNCLGPVTEMVALKIDHALIIDPFLLSSLDVFATDQHPSVAFKGGAKREGHSVYSLLNRRGHKQTSYRFNNTPFLLTVGNRINVNNNDPMFGYLGNFGHI